MHKHNPLLQPQSEQPDAELLLPSSDLAVRPHTHYETCERRRDKELRWERGLQCGSVVALTLMVMFVCGMLVGMMALQNGV